MEGRGFLLSCPFFAMMNGRDLSTGVYTCHYSANPASESDRYRFIIHEVPGTARFAAEQRRGPSQKLETSELRQEEDQGIPYVQQKATQFWKASTRLYLFLYVRSLLSHFSHLAWRASPRRQLQVTYV